MTAFAALAITLAEPAFSDVPAAAFDVSDTVAVTDLKAVTGREDLAQVAQAEQSAVVSRNSVSGQSVTGSVRIDDNAFQNLSGLSVINANTGNNVAINAAMNVNISLSPGG